MWSQWSPSWRSRQRPSRHEETPEETSSKSPTPLDLTISTELKNEGNELFRRGKYRAAAEKYTEAISIRPNWNIPLVNRANCYKKLEEWSKVETDCRSAIAIDHQSMKAHYFLGLALEQRFELNTALIHLEKSYELARDKGDQIMDEIWKTIARVSYHRWQRASEQRSHDDARFKERLKTLLLEAHQKESLSTDSIRQEELKMLEEVFRRAGEQDQPKEVPSCLTCVLTMEVFRDPVVCPSGFSYERSDLMEHLERVGAFDPITREPIEKSQLVKNLNLRSNAHLYLNEHPWAWKDIM